MEGEKQKPYKVKDVTRNIKKAVVASTLEEVRLKSAEKFGKNEEMPTIHLDSDGTEIDDEDYFQTLEPNAELIAVFPGEEWMDPTHYVTITTHRESLNGDTTDAAAEVEKIHLKKLVGQLKNNLCNVSVLSEPDLESLSNMDPNSLADITGKDFVEQLKEASGRILSEKRQALNAVDLLKLLAKHKFVSSEQVSPADSNSPEDDPALSIIEIVEKQSASTSPPPSITTEKTSMSSSSSTLSSSSDIVVREQPKSSSSSTSVTSINQQQEDI